MRRVFSRLHSSTPQMIHVSFRSNRTNQLVTIQEPSTSTRSLLELTHQYDAKSDPSQIIGLEGACDGSCACSTCHIILPKEIYEKCIEPTEEELDMLDLAYGCTETSRLACQLKCTPVLHNVVINVPKETRNMSVDGYIPKPH